MVGSKKQPRWALFKRQFSLLREDGVDYLTRWWIVCTPWGGVAVHRIRQPDWREHYHDHEAPFFSIVLLGGYVEHHLDEGWPAMRSDVSVRHITRFNQVGLKDFHVLKSVDRDPTWTLMFIGKDRGRL